MRFRKLLTTAALSIGLGVAANAQVEILHYYSSEGTTITNDLVGDADGTLFGSSLNDTSAVVTDGGANGGGWNGGDPGQGMRIPDSVAEEMGTNDWTISLWTEVSEFENYATDFAFSDWTTGGDFFLGAPYPGRRGNHQYITWQNGGADYVVNQGDVGLDLVGPLATLNTLYHKVITYDGSTMTLYIDGVSEDNNEGPGSWPISGIDMSTMPHAAINAGSPWSDNAINGTTYAFGVFGEALEPEMVTELFLLGKDATIAQIPGIANAPFKLREASPTGTAVVNPVTLSLKVIDNAESYSSAEFYLNDSLDPIAVDSVVNEGTGTNVLYSEALILEPTTEYDVTAIVTGDGSGIKTNTWSFTTDDRFVISVSPEAVATAYDFQPTISAEIIDVMDAVDYVELYVDGSYASLEVGGSGTTTVSYTTGTLAPGDTVEAELIVYTLGIYGTLTNNWSIMMGGTPGVTVWNPDAPPLGGFDIAQTNGALDYTENVGPDAEQTIRHEWTYISDGDRPAQGQTFTTPAGGLAYYVDSVWLRDPAYNDGGSNLSTTGNTFTVRITNPAMTNTAQFVRSSQQLTLHNSFTQEHSGEWIQFRLPEPVVVLANQVYGFDVGSVGGYYVNTDGSNSDPYAGGNAYRSGDNGDGNLMAELNTLGDRTFIVQLSEAVDAFSVEARLPTGSGIQNPAQLQVDFTELSGTFDQANTKMLLDGVEQIVNPATGSSPNYTITADLLDQEPLTTHTGMVVLASSFPVTTLTNTWTFTMGNAYAFSGQSPQPGRAIQEEDTAVSLDVISIADYFYGATMHIDGGANVGPTIETSGSTSTVSIASTGVLDYGPHTVDVIVEGSFGFVTNSWEFSVKEKTTDSVWNINIAGNLTGTRRNVDDGTLIAAPGFGSNLWNNVAGTSGGSGFGGGEPATNSFIVTDGLGDRPIGFIGSGIGYWGETDASEENVNQQLFDGWWGANAYMDVEAAFTGLATSASYDIYLYSTWRWNENDVTYNLVEGFTDGPEELLVTAARGDIRNTSIYDYSGIAEGVNYAVFRDVTPNTNGIITISGGYEIDAVLSGIQIHEYPGQADLPQAALVSATPTGTLTDTNNAPIIEAVYADSFGSVETNDVALLLNGAEIPTFDIEKVGLTTTVSYASSPLDPGQYTVGVVYVPGKTSEWSFVVAYETVKPTSLVHHWDFMDGSGTTVTDIEGGADGTIFGTNHMWLVGGGLDLLGGGSSSDWNETTLSGAGSYVDLPNGTVSALGNAATFEATYISEADNWARVFSFGISGGGEDISDGGAGQIFLAAQAPSGGPRGEKAGTFSIDSSTEFEGSLSHVVIVFDADNYIAKMYQNGELKGTQLITTFSPLSELNDLNNWIGRGQWPDPMFNGQIYDLRMYNGVMTAAEVQARYDEIVGAPVEGPPIDLAIPAGGPLMIAWPTSYGTDFSVLTNDDLLNADGWGIADLVPYDDGEGYYVITNDIGGETSLFYILESN